jgi:uncharacterized Zn-binding protein involved in type VI secretion
MLLSVVFSIVATCKQPPRFRFKKPLESSFLTCWGWSEMIVKGYGWNWGRGEWAVFFAIIVLGIVGIAVAEMSGPTTDITGTVSKAEPPVQQDGTAAHPYADENHCPAKVDIIFWSREDRPIPTIPPGISVCFVGDRSANTGGPQLELRGR